MKLTSLPKWLLVGALRVYQKTLSFDHGPMRRLYPYGFCRFHPTCSEYGCQALGRYGVFYGLFLIIRRLLRCNPWNPGGADPVL